jgi:MFS family permease
MGLNLDVDNRYYSSDIAAGHILSQSPPPGTVVRREWRVRVAESLGPQKVDVADTVGTQGRVAALRLRRAGLEVGATAKLPFAGVEDGTVLAQDPPAHSQGIAQPSVNILVAAPDTTPPDGYVMPDVTGMPVISAQDMLTKIGLKVDIPNYADVNTRRSVPWVSSPSPPSPPAPSLDNSPWPARALTSPPPSNSPQRNSLVRLPVQQHPKQRRMPPDSSDTPKPSTLPSGLSGYSHAWRALRHRNFRLFFGGQSISLIGTWMTRVATSWLVYRLTGSALVLGTVGFVGLIPTFVLAPIAGVIVDRIDRRKVLLWTQALAMVQSLALAWLTLSNRITITEVLALSAMQGVINAFDMPGRQAFMVQMVEERADLSNAIAINSSMVNAARLVGPSLAGLVIAATNEGWCFLIDGISYIAVIASLLMMRVRVGQEKRATASMIEQLKEGWEYVSSFVPVRTILLLFALVSLMGMPFVVLMPVFAAQVLHGGPHTLGFLMGALGVGALISALSLVVRKSVRGLSKMIPIAAAVFGAGLIAFGFSTNQWLSLLLMLVTGFGMMQGMTASNTIIQTLVPEDKRGRVMSYYTIAFVGMAPFGSLLAGGLAHAIGAQRTVIISGIACISGALWFWSHLKDVRKGMRPIYEQLGIIQPRVPIVVEEEVSSN